MEIRDGFIVGVYNYCDRWCERCAFTSYCQVFAHETEVDASFDPNMRSIVDASQREGSTFPALWIEEEESAPLPGVPPERRAIEALALAYATKLHEWFEGAGGEASKATEQSQVIAHFGILIAMKVHRALLTWPDDDSDELPGTSDQEGSAKTALMAIDRSHDAWRELVACGQVSDVDAGPFVADLVWIRDGSHGRLSTSPTRSPG